MMKSPNRGITALLCLVTGIALSFSSCQKEPVESELQVLLKQYPSEITMENWQEFVDAPQEVIDYHANLMEGNTSPQPETGSSNNRTQTCNYQGWVKAWSSGWTQMANTAVEAERVYSPGGILFTETTDLSTPYNFCNNSSVTYTRIRWYFKSASATYTQPEWVKGVSTLDLVHIQRHINGTTLFTSLRQYLAADADMDGDIDSDDIDDIRDLILVNTNSLPSGGVVCNSKNQPFFYIWADDYTAFDAMTNNGSAYLSDMYTYNCVLPLPQPPNNTLVDLNAYAIKRGDVSGNWTP